MKLLFLTIWLWCGVHAVCTAAPAQSCVVPATETGNKITACGNIGGCTYTGVVTGPYYPEKCVFSGGCCAKFDLNCATFCKTTTPGNTLIPNCERFLPPPTVCTGYVSLGFGDEGRCTTAGCDYKGTDGKGTCKPRYKPRPCTNTKSCTEYLDFLTNFTGNVNSLLTDDLKSFFNALVVDQEAFAEVWKTQSGFYSALITNANKDDFADVCGDQLHTCLSFCARNSQFCSQLWYDYASVWTNSNLRNCIINGTKTDCETEEIYLNCNNTWECRAVVLGLYECKDRAANTHGTFYGNNREYCDILENGVAGCGTTLTNFNTNTWKQCVQFVTKAFGSTVGGGTVPIHLVGPLIAFHPFAPHP